MIRTMKSPSPLCEPRYSSPKPNNDRVALDTSLDLPPKSLSSTILMEDGQNIQKWHPNNLTEDSMKCLNFIYDRLLRTTRVMELEKSGPVSRSAHFFLSSKSFRVDNAASCLSKSMNLVSYKESRQQDPYGIFDVEASLARDIGPYKNLVIFTSSSMDSKCISSSSSVSLIRKLRFDGMSQLYWLEPWGPNVMLPGSTPAGGELLIPVTKVGTGPSGSGKNLPGEDIHRRWSGNRAREI
ncbi:hypothetical protein YC2023_118966 [Brassica napus]